MSECDTVRPQLMALLDNELSAVAAALLELHLGDCDACAKVLAGYRALQEAAMLTVLPGAVDLWTGMSDELTRLPEQVVAAELRLVRTEIQALSAEVALLRRELLKRPLPSATRGNALSLPDAPTRSLRQFRLV